MTTDTDLKKARIDALRAALPIGEALGADLSAPLAEIERLRAEILAGTPHQRAERRPQRKGERRAV